LVVNPRRILIVIKNLQQGGTERQVLRLIRCLDPGKYTVALCTLFPEVHYTDIPTNVKRYVLNIRSARAVDAIRGVIDDFQPDLVHSFRDGVNRFVWRALRGTVARIPWLMSVRGRPVLPMDLLWARIMCKRAFRITTNSVGIERSLRWFAGVSRRQIAVIPNFIDKKAFHPASAVERTAARTALGLSESAFVWVLPARISWVKNQLGLMESMRRLKSRGCLPPGTVVVLAGRARSNPGVPAAQADQTVWIGALCACLRCRRQRCDPLCSRRCIGSSFAGRGNAECRA
jgi:hypothetical protein